MKTPKSEAGNQWSGVSDRTDLMSRIGLGEWRGPCGDPVARENGGARVTRQSRGVQP